MEYDDGLVACTDSELLIRRYGALLGTKRIPYERIRGVAPMQLSGLRGRWRIWGSGDLRHWWNLDTKRPQKQVALVLDVGTRTLPTITPDDPGQVAAVLRRHGVDVPELTASS